MRWPWQRRRGRPDAQPSPAVLAAQRRLQRAHEDTKRLEEAARRLAELPAEELVERFGRALRGGR
jgi:hypothetical protein